MVSTRHRRQMRATSLSRAGNRRLGLDHSCVTHINISISTTTVLLMKG
jgi:hypothetical protein